MQAEALENAFKNETVGLVTKAEFMSRRSTLAERLGEETRRAKREADDSASLVRHRFSFEMSLHTERCGGQYRLLRTPPHWCAASQQSQPSVYAEQGCGSCSVWLSLDQGCGTVNAPAQASRLQLIQCWHWAACCSGTLSSASQLPLKTGATAWSATDLAGQAGVPLIWQGRLLSTLPVKRLPVLVACQVTRLGASLWCNTGHRFRSGSSAQRRRRSCSSRPSCPSPRTMRRRRKKIKTRLAAGTLQTQPRRIPLPGSRRRRSPAPAVTASPRRLRGQPRGSWVRAPLASCLLSQLPTALLRTRATCNLCVMDVTCATKNHQGLVLYASNSSQVLNPALP